MYIDSIALRGGEFDQRGSGLHPDHHRCRRLLIVGFADQRLIELLSSIAGDAPAVATDRCTAVADATLLMLLILNYDESIVELIDANQSTLIIDTTDVVSLLPLVQSSACTDQTPQFHCSC